MLEGRIFQNKPNRQRSIDLLGQCSFTPEQQAFCVKKIDYVAQNGEDILAESLPELKTALEEDLEVLAGYIPQLTEVVRAGIQATTLAVVEPVWGSDHLDDVAIKIKVSHPIVANPARVIFTTRLELAGDTPVDRQTQLGLNYESREPSIHATFPKRAGISTFIEIRQHITGPEFGWSLDIFHGSPMQFADNQSANRAHIPVTIVTNLVDLMTSDPEFILAMSDPWDNRYFLQSNWEHTITRYLDETRLAKVWGKFSAARSDMLVREAKKSRTGLLSRIF